MTAFAYQGLRRHLLGRGTLGFERRTQADTTPGRQLRTEETRRQDLTMATELAPYKILVNCIAPGATYSELTTPMYTPSVKEALFQRVPLREIAQPEWIAAGVVLLHPMMLGI